ncbi:MAG: translation elongation factor-like protein [Nitrospirae bacterium]|nr:translation elongation factor-like protein [Nitrospirota bacterium]
MKEERIGVVSHYFGHLGVAAVVLEGELAVGETIHVRGHSTDLTQKVESIQLEHESISRARKGQDVGIKVKDHVREHDVVYKVTEDES